LLIFNPLGIVTMLVDYVNGQCLLHFRVTWAKKFEYICQFICPSSSRHLTAPEVAFVKTKDFSIS